MTMRVLVALLTIAVFLAGYAARVLTEPSQAVPPVPAAITTELAPSAGGTVNKSSTPALDRAKLVAEITKLRPQIVAYTAQVTEIEDEFEVEFVKLLNPVQREKRIADKKRYAERDAKKIADRTPLSDRDIQMAQERPLTSIYWQVTVTPRLEQLTKDYTLNAAQQTSVRSLLALRRTKYFALLDATPHPSIRLSRLAPLIERVAAPGK